MKQRTLANAQRIALRSPLTGSGSKNAPETASLATGPIRNQRTAKDCWNMTCCDNYVAQQKHNGASYA